MRLFYGIEIPRKIKEQIGDFELKLQQHGIRAGNWTAANLLHITVIFLGEVDEQRANAFTGAGNLVAGIQSPFELTLDHIGLFSGSRILWLGLRTDPGYHELQDLHQRLSRTLCDSTDFHPDARPYSPHVTLARKVDLKSSSVVHESAVDVSPSLKASVQEFCLFESKRVNGQLMYPVISRFVCEG